jgi:hypothetical protein
MVMIEM